MKKYAVAAVLITTFSLGTAYAEAPKAEKTDAVKKLEDSRKLIEQKKSELNGSQWELDMTASDAKGKVEKEVFTFQNGQVTCKMLTARGFKPTNYTISVPEGSDMAVWETMQTNDKGNVVFIRGEWKQDIMRGVISEQLEGGKSRDYNFASASKIAVEPTTKPKEEPKKEEPKAAAEPVKAESAKVETAATAVADVKAEAAKDGAVVKAGDTAKPVVKEVSKKKKKKMF
jgi:hypothetical protein